MELFRERGFQVKKKRRGFRIITKDTFAVAGTHGKTTTGILGHIYMSGPMLLHYRRNRRNYNSNLIGDGKQ
jgi:hypothetical protein